MGLFDKVFGVNRAGAATAALDGKESVAALMLATVAADGVITEDELTGFTNAVNRMSMFRAMGQAGFSKMLQKLLGMLKKDGPEALVGVAVSSVPPDYRETAFALCADLVMGDGEVDPAEERLLDQMYKALGVSEELAHKVIQVMAIKNKV